MFGASHTTRALLCTEPYASSCNGTLFFGGNCYTPTRDLSWSQDFVLSVPEVEGRSTRSLGRTGTKKRAILLVHAILPALGTFQSLLNVLGCVSGKQHFGGLEKFTATHSVLVYLEIN